MSTVAVTMGHPRVSGLHTREPYISGPYATGPYATGPRTPHLRLTRRGRRVFTALAAVPLVVGALVFALNGGGATASADLATGDFQYVTVESGQSLWQLAESLAPGADPREVVADIVLLNQLEGSVVYPGERLAIPVAYSR